MDRRSSRIRLTREEAKAQTREALLEAAAEIFSRKGFHGASIDMVADAAGYTKGAVYAHFRSKEDLYLALLDKHLAGEPPPWTAQLESGVPIDEFAAEVERDMPQFLEQTRAWGMLTIEFFLHAMRDETVRARLSERFATARRDYAKVLEKRYQATGQPPPFKIEPLSAALLAFENGLSIIGLIDPENLKDGVYTETLKRLLDP